MAHLFFFFEKLGLNISKNYNYSIVVTVFHSVHVEIP